MDIYIYIYYIYYTMAAQEVCTLCSRYPEVDQILVHFLFCGQGQRKTHVTSVRGIVEDVQRHLAPKLL